MYIYIIDIYGCYLCIITNLSTMKCTNQNEYIFTISLYSDEQFLLFQLHTEYIPVICTMYCATVV